ncbi:MAG: type VI secretion system Vgr family protein [Pyrinomonadaceae bacterium]
MPDYTQANRPLAVATPLGEDVLLLVGLNGHEAISQLFSFQLDLLAEDRSKVKFDKLLGRPIGVRLLLPEDKERYFNGICRWVSQGARDDTFTSYRMEIVPQFWFLTKTARSRIFQHLSVPEILKKVFEGLDVTLEIQGTFHPRDFCVQYRESDFNFASRLMEEEGIFYFFKHTAGGHTMVVANSPDSHPNLENPSSIIYEELGGGVREEERINSWEKKQELRTGKYTLWDHCFEKPHEKLEGQIAILDSLTVGTVNHKLKLGTNEQLEIYDYPGAYAQRFDGIDKGGSEQAAELSKIHTADSERTTKIRMEQETLPGVVIEGSSNCRHFVSGYKFELNRHFDANGEYVLTGISHSARMMGAGYRSDDGEFIYENSFACIPFDVSFPFTPPQMTPKPTVRGSQTAVVVGPEGEEIFVDKYGRVKVQFHWDRESKANADSSCWIRVGQNMAGIRWGAAFWPRIGHEVVVDFLEGDPDQPIIIGSVYNASEMPPYKLPDEKTKTVIFKSNSSKGGGGFNEFRVEDKKGKEQIFINAERNKDIRIKNDRYETVCNNSHFIVIKDQLEQVKGDKHLQVKGDHNEKVGGTASLTVGQNQQVKVGQNYALNTGAEIHLKSGVNIVIETATSLTLKVGGNFININPGGIFIKGTMVMINSGGSAGSGAGSSPATPKDPVEADKADPGDVSRPPPAAPPPKPVTYSPAALVMKQAAQQGTPFCYI